MGMTRSEAIAKVSRWCDAQSYPEINSTEIGEIVDQFARFSYWTASTAYSVGDRIVPSVANGRVYECKCAGTSGVTEPDWPDYPGGQFMGQGFTDGSSDPKLLWVDMGPSFVERYDARSAAQEVWLVKASRVVGEIDSKEGSTEVKLAQLMERCIEMSKKFRPVTFA